MILPGKLPKSTRMPWSAFSPWKSSSLTSSVCRKKGSSSLDAWMRRTFGGGGGGQAGSAAHACRGRGAARAQRAHRRTPAARGAAAAARRGALRRPLPRPLPRAPPPPRTLRLWFCRVTPDRMRKVSASAWSSRSCCFSSTGIGFQYSVDAVCRSKPRASSSLAAGMAPPGAAGRVVAAQRGRAPSARRAALPLPSPGGEGPPSWAVEVAAAQTGRARVIWEPKRFGPRLGRQPPAAPASDRAERGGPPPVRLAGARGLRAPWRGARVRGRAPACHPRARGRGRAASAAPHPPPPPARGPVTARGMRPLRVRARHRSARGGKPGARLRHGSRAARAAATRQRTRPRARARARALLPPPAVQGTTKRSQLVAAPLGSPPDGRSARQRARGRKNRDPTRARNAAGMDFGVPTDEWLVCDGGASSAGGRGAGRAWLLTGLPKPSRRPAMRGDGGGGRLSRPPRAPRRLGGPRRRRARAGRRRAVRPRPRHGAVGRASRLPEPAPG